MLYELRREPEDTFIRFAAGPFYFLSAHSCNSPVALLFLPKPCDEPGWCASGFIADPCRAVQGVLLLHIRCETSLVELQARYDGCRKLSSLNRRLSLRNVTKPNSARCPESPRPKKKRGHPMPEPGIHVADEHPAQLRWCDGSAKFSRSRATPRRAPFCFAVPRRARIPGHIQCSTRPLPRCCSCTKLAWSFRSLSSCCFQPTVTIAPTRHAGTYPGQV